MRLASRVQALSALADSSAAQTGRRRTLCLPMRNVAAHFFLRSPSAWQQQVACQSKSIFTPSSHASPRASANVCATRC